MRKNKEIKIGEKEKKGKGLLADLLIIGGLGAIGTGLWWMWPWAALVVVGVICFVMGVLGILK